VRPYHTGLLFMIAVIADDFSGAAELANAAVHAGFSTEVQLRFQPGTAADVICLDTGTRSLPPESAAKRVEEIARAMAAIRPELVYKKCDSVLRGPVAAECLAVARALGNERVLLIPANPSRQRIIRGGEYFVAGIPLAQTAFAHDPDHPRKSSRVSELIGPAPGVEFPDAGSAEDLIRHAATIGANVLPAGGVDFFSALLTAKSRPVQTPPAGVYALSHAEGPTLWVCGSHDAWRAGRGEQCAGRGIPVGCMPKGLFEQELREDILVRWATLAAGLLRENGAVLLAIGGEEPVPGVTPAMLVDRLARAVELVLEQTTPARLLLEGGATAAAVAGQLGFDRFRAEASPGPGVGALRPVSRENIFFLTKPGSYAWPDTVFG
jgi:hypothetical protein